MYVNFIKNVVDGKPDFALYTLRISEYFKYTSAKHLSVNVLPEEATLKSH